jgi:hypothetical protein
MSFLFRLKRYKSFTDKSNFFQKNVIDLEPNHFEWFNFPVKNLVNHYSNLYFYEEKNV